MQKLAYRRLILYNANTIGAKVERREEHIGRAYRTSKNYYDDFLSGKGL